MTRGERNVLTVWIISVVSLRTVVAVMKAPLGSDEDEEASPVDLFVRVPDITVVLLEVAVREDQRWRGGAGSRLGSGRFYLTGLG